MRVSGGGSAPTAARQKMIEMVISMNELNLRNVVFSNQYSRLMILDRSEAGSAPAFSISLSRDDPTGIRYNLMSFTPTYEGKPVECRYEADPGVLTLIAEQGKLEICFAPAGDVLKFRSTEGIGVQFHIDFAMHELFVDRLDGSVEIGFSSMGEFLFEVVKGAQTHNNMWIGPKMCATPTDVDWTPADGVLEGYINWNTEYVEKLAFGDFDVDVAANRESFNAWLKKFPETAEIYAPARQAAGYLTWICDQKALWRLKEDAAYMARCGVDQRASAWLQSFYAMAAWRDQGYAFDLLHSFFAMQDKYGMIPGTADDRLVDYALAYAPVQGFALNWILDRIGDENVCAKQCERLYDPMCAWVNWWKEYRAGSNGLACYNRAAEAKLGAGLDFWYGTPVETPDLQAYLILCMEACGRLAKILGKEEAAAAHFAEAKAWTEKLVAELWDGETFVCKTACGCKSVNSQSALACVPVILGKRLPEEILQKLVKRLADSRKFCTEKGFASESMDSPLAKCCCPSPEVQQILTVGLWQAGETALAEKAAENWCKFFLQPCTAVREVPGSAGCVGSIVFFTLAELLK